MGRSRDPSREVAMAAGPPPTVNMRAREAVEVTCAAGPTRADTFSRRLGSKFGTGMLWECRE